jgi:succinyl-CoA synthetase beta subunit
MKCDLIVESLLEAATQERFKVPIVLRLKGTNVERAGELIKGKEESLGIHFTDDFDYAARLAVDLAKK